MDPHGNQHQLSSPLRKKTTNEFHLLFSHLTAYSLSYFRASVKHFFALGDPGGNRTHVNGVRGRCLNRLTTGPHDAISQFIPKALELGAKSVLCEDMPEEKVEGVTYIQQREIVGVWNDPVSVQRTERC